MTTRPLSRSFSLAYAAPAAAMAAMQVALTIFLPKYYTDVVRVPVALVSATLIAVRIFDAVTDPLIGWASDRTASRWGRRRPWMTGFSIPLVIGFILLMNPWNTLGTTAVQVWFAVGVFAVYFCWTAVAIPYESLGAEITFDYDERTSVLGLRDGFLLVGTVVAAGFPVALAAGGIGDDDAGEARKFLFMSLAFSALLLATVTWSVLVVREKPGQHVSNTVPSWTTFKEMMSNRPFRLLLIAYTVSAIGSNLPGTMILYYCDYVLKTTRGEFLLLLYMIMAIAALPLWIKLAQRYGKRELWLASMVVNLGSFVWAFPLGEGDVALFTLIIAISGSGGGAAIALPHAMQPDVIDYDEWMTGQRREGQYIGVWTFAKKVAAAFGVGAALAILGRLGYEPNVEQTESVQLAIRIVYILVPVACYGVAFAIGWRYPLDRHTHERMRAEIAQRKRAQAEA